MTNQPTPEQLEKLIKLYQQIDNLTEQNARNMAEIAKNAGNVNKEISRLEKEASSLTDSFSSIAQSLKDSLQEFSKYNTIASSTKKSFSALQSIASKMLNDQSGYTRLSEKEIIKLKQKVALEAQNLATNISSGRLTKEQIKEAEDVLKKTNQLIKDIKVRLELEREITKAIGVTGNALKGLSKIPGIGSMLKTEEAIDEMKEYAETLKAQGENITSFSNRLKIAGKGLKVAFGGIKETLTDPVSILTFIVTKALDANTQIVNLGKSLGSSSEKYRENLVDIERSTNNLNVTTKNLVEAYSELATATGFAYEFTADQLTTQIKLTKQVGLTADEAAQVQRFAVLNNKTSEETYRSFLKGITAARNQLKVGIDFKATLAEASKVSGQLAAQLGNNPELIGRAVVSAKALGMTLEQVAKAGSTLLDFGSSISSELEAELLTGKQINLERARAAALVGDQITLAEELAKNMGTAAEFTKLNKLQQDSLAKSIGISSDELAETLRKREEAIASGKSLAQVTEEEAAQALERQSIQDKFNAAVEKLQSLFGNILAGPLGGFLDILSGALNIVNLIGNALSFLATPLKIIAGIWATIKGLQLASLVIIKAQTIYEKMQLGYAVGQRGIAMGYNGILLARQALLSGELAKSIAIAAAWAVTNPLTALVGLAVAGTVAAGLYALTADDMIQPGYGKRTLLSPEGTIKLNDKDTVIAGTNLGSGEGRGSMPQIDLTPMISAINEVRAAVDRLYSKDQSINMDGKKVGTTLVQGSYKVA